MIIGNLSPSKLEAVRLCEARLAGRLNQLGEGEWEEEHGEPAAVGGLAHGAAKHWYRPCPQWITRVRAGESPEALAAQADTLRKQAVASIPQVPLDDVGATAEYKEKVQAAVNAADEQIFTEGLLKHPYSDPGYCFRKAIDDGSRSEAIPGKVENELPREAGGVSESRDMFESIIHHYIRDNLNIVFGERRYKGTLANGVKVHLIIDLGIDRGGGRLEIVDYKTGYITCTTDEMYSKDQVLMNMLAVERYDSSLGFYPHKSFTYLWVRQGFETGPVSFTRERLTDYEHYLAVMYQHLLNLKDPSESINRFCGSCPRRLGACGRYRIHVAEAMGLLRSVTAEEIGDIDMESLCARHDTLNGQIKILEESKKNISGIVKGRLEVDPKKQWVGEAYKATVRQNKSDGYDTATVLSLCTINGVDASSVVSVGKKKVEETFGNNPQAMQMLSVTMRRGATSAFVDVRKLGSKQEAKSVKGNEPPT